ncbi:hypothetical protein [Riemerella columbipharyngis]|uniref:Uncharacterized protein n=1 Tax=Riemerella columbipharyngis TaxID=1071918 RepID=A0A1G7FDR1_9FLAO|nr:hypothetical protein [Riemerella columbipharyngis]SDE74032.1 hypothetical protein SAMN05421544_1225 [Riemerella columbipharyngis]
MELPKRYFLNDLKELNERFKKDLQELPQSPKKYSDYKTICSSVEVLLDMVVCLSLQPNGGDVLSKSELLKHCTERLSFSYDSLYFDLSQLQKSLNEYEQ